MIYIDRSENLNTSICNLQTAAHPSTSLQSKVLKKQFWCLIVTTTLRKT